MREVAYYRAPLPQVAVYDVDSAECHAAPHFGVAHVEQLYCLEYIVGEIAVEAAPYGVKLMAAFVRKARGEIAVYQAAAVAHYEV